ncbi:MAG: hypothetical protein ACR2J8_12230, partial [Thermomicrobiales bacterium]
MDQSRFDRITRMFAMPVSRRAGIAAVAAALSGRGIMADAAPVAAGGLVATGVCGSGKNSRCGSNSDCCTNYCDTKKKRCRCIKRNQPCKTKQTCCAGMACKNGRCQPSDAGCKPATCPDGCCAGGICQNGRSASACGTGGAVCAVCAAGKFCSSGYCGQWVKRTAFGSEGQGANQFYYPRSNFVASNGSYGVIADTGNARISIWQRNGANWQPKTTFGTLGSGPGQFDNPTGVSVSADGDTISVADTVNNRISIWQRRGGSWGPVDRFGSAGDGLDDFSLPTGVVVSSDGTTAWIADKNNNRVSIWVKDGGAWQGDTTFGSAGNGPENFSYPNGLYVSGDGQTVAVADSANDRVSVGRKAGSGWENQAIFGSTGSGPDQFDNPTRIFIAADGLTAWVADTNNDRISVWVRNGQVWSN